MTSIVKIGYRIALQIGQQDLWQNAQQKHTTRTDTTIISISIIIIIANINVLMPSRESYNNSNITPDYFYATEDEQQIDGDGGANNVDGRSE
ncbi:hypothetical protein EVAR_73622_1 [Eumeta japonica]|uniref:Uncharacterized protein n=1 Tax=Eumeta variegata TaxID=151549 RepID=A0A4C1SPW4_EUMVA|nr:hypothetical protein EVAR_73622_1 [Eumeta japonica]